MPKFFTALVLLLLGIAGFTQQNSNNTNKVDKALPRPLGSFIILYTSKNLEINAWEVFEVWDTKIIGERELAEQLRDKINHSIVASYHWKPGFRWDDAARFARSRSSKFAFKNSYTTVDGQGNKFNPNSSGGGYTSVYTGDAKRTQADGEVIDFSKEDYIAQLTPSEINTLKPKFVTEQTRLIQNGWVRYASNYESTPTKYLYFNKQLDWEYSYTAIAVALDTGIVVKVNCSASAIGTTEQEIPKDSYFAYYDMQSPKMGVTYEIKINSPKATKVPIGLIVFRRKTNLEKEMEEIISNAATGFNGLKGELTTSAAGEEYFGANLKLGMTHSKIYFDIKQAIWVYELTSNAENADAQYQYGKLLQLLTNHEKNGKYLLEKNQKDGVDTTIVFDKDKKKLMTLVSSKAITAVYFYSN
jgi:hypothetical protein